MTEPLPESLLDMVRSFDTYVTLDYNNTREMSLDGLSACEIEAKVYINILDLIV